MSGVEVQVNWRDVEPVEGRPNWSQLDSLFGAAEAAKRWVQLGVFPGFFSPAWALEGVQSDAFAIQYGPDHGTIARLPMPWDRVYLARWFTFVRQLAQRYGGSPAFRMIQAAGPTSVSSEMTLPSSRPAVQKLLGDGYTPAKYLAAWDQTLRVFADAFPKQCVLLSGPSLPILAQGRVDRAEHQRAREEIVDRAMRTLGDRLAIQSSDLHAGHARVEAPDYTDFINGYSGRVITGFEMRGGSTGPGPSEIMGAAGNPPLALRRSIDKGMAPNAAGRHVDYLEIYEGDVLSPDMQPVLQYAESLFQP
ncbi:MAG: hypothetical protein ABSH03_05835 [Candidatus Lustribacter sp.]